MDNSECNDENTPKKSLTLNEKRKPLESPFSAFSPAQRLAKKKGRILTEPGDSNLDASLFDESVLHTENTDSFDMPVAYKPKVLFANGDVDEEASADMLSAVLNESTLDHTQNDGDRTFSSETRPFVPSSADPNLDETHLDMSMNQTFSNVAKPLVPSSIDPNLDETLAEMTMNETFSNVVRPLVPCAVDPNMEETLADTTINQTQHSSADDSLYAGKEDDLDDDENRTLEEEKEENVVAASTGNGGVSLFEEMNTLELTVPVDLAVTEEEKSAVEASQEHSAMQGGGMSLFEELNTQSGSEGMDDGEGQKTEDMDMCTSHLKEGESSLKEEENAMATHSTMDESILSTITAVGITTKDVNRQYYNDIKQRLSSIAQTPQMEKEKETDGLDSTPTQSSVLAALRSPASASYGYSMNNTMMGSPSPSRNTRFSMMNDSHISFILNEAEATSSVYTELKRDMAALQEELTQSRELTERVEKERDNARKEVDDYVFMMETTKKRMISEKTYLTKQICDLEGELMEARRMSSVVEEEGRKVEEMEKTKMELEEKMKRLEEDMKEESGKYEEEKERLTVRVEEMERQMEEERKKANEEIERRVGEVRMELERKMEEILVQKNDIICQLEKMECESGEKEYSNEEMERRLEGEKAMMEARLNEMNMEKKEIEEELGRTKMENEEVRRGKREIEEQMEIVKREKEETDRKMMEVTEEFNGMKKSMDELRSAALDDSKMSHDLSAQVEQLKMVNGEMRGTIEEKEKEIESLRTSLSLSCVAEGRVREMERRVEELEKEKDGLEMSVENMQKEREMGGKLESRMEELMNGLMIKTNEHFKETSALNEQIIELKKKLMETEVEMKAVMRELESNEDVKKGMERDMERMKEEKASMETTINSLKKELDEAIMANTEEKEKIKIIEEMKDVMNRRVREMEEDKEKEVKEKTEELERLKIEMEIFSARLMESENEKKEALKKVEEERERNDVLSDTVRQLENEIESRTVTTSVPSVVSTGMEEAERKRLEEELKEERERVSRLQKEVKRLEDTCDEFDDIENELKTALVEKQKKIDDLEGKTIQAGPSLLEALKPTNMEIKAMNETVVDPVREGAGKEEKEEKEEYGTPSGSVYEGEEGTKMMEGEATLGVTKYDETRRMEEEDEEEEEEYEKANVTRPNASCRQS